MESSTSQLLQSRYFSPVFNTAIFDGGFRVYFAQNQETEALKLYLKLQNRFKTEVESESESKPVIFVMMYPNEESFEQVFDSKADTCMENLGEDVIIGLKGPFDEDVYSRIEMKLKELDWA